MTTPTNQTVEKLLAWARYLFWCDLHRRRLERYDGRAEDGTPDQLQWVFIALIAQWYASLWVVVEGWSEIRQPDPVIDDLLASCPRLCDLMKRFRNGVYHYQPSLVEPKLLDVLRESDVTYVWAYLLHQEFCRFFWHWVHQVPDDRIQKEMRHHVREILGWIPVETMQEQLRGSEVLRRRVLQLLATSDDPSGPAAVDLLESAGHLEQAERQGKEGFSKWRRDLIALVKERGAQGQ
jgi:hypothetical protein